MIIANVVVGPVKQLNMRPLEALLVAIPVMIQGRGYTDYFIILIHKYQGRAIFIPVKGLKVEPLHVHLNDHQTITQAVTIWPFTFLDNKLSLLIQ